MTLAAAARPLTLLVVDDHTLFRRGLIALLGQDAGLEVVGRRAMRPKPCAWCRACSPT